MNIVIWILKALVFDAFYDNYSLKITSEFIDKTTGQTKESNVRVEIGGLHNIQSWLLVFHFFVVKHQQVIVTLILNRLKISPQFRQKSL